MSWLNLSNNLSNLSGNFTSITGQISNFTREVLTDGIEEPFDQDTELKLAHVRLKDLESALQKQKDEIERVNMLNEELNDRVASSELQLKALSDEYRGVIELKEQEIKQLKSSQIDMKHDHYLSHKDEPYSKEGMEFEDPEFFQMTISKLKQELEEVNKECQYWKDAARNQNNQAELQQLKDHHQQEIASLQGTYTKRMSVMNKKHQDELEDLMLENEKLSNQIKEYEAMTSNQEFASSATSTSGKFEEKYKTLSIDFEIKKKQLESLQAQTIEEKHLRKAKEEENVLLLLDIKERNEKIIELEGEVESLLTNQSEKEKTVSFDTNEKEKLEELDRNWRAKFDNILQNLNELRDENVAITLELSQFDEKYKKVIIENEDLLEKNGDMNAEIEALKSEKKQLEESVRGLEKLKDDISRLGNCTSDLLEELQFQKGLSEEQLLEIDSLRKICTIKGSPADEIKKMQKSLKELGRRYVELYQHYQKVSLELRKSNDRLRAELQLRHSSTSQLRKEISFVQQRLGKSVDSKVESCQKDAEHIHSRLSELDDQLDRRERLVAELQIDNDYVSDDVAKVVSDLGHHSDRSNKNSSENNTIESLIAEKSILERTIEGLERKVGSLEAIVAGTHEDCSTVDGTSSPPRTIESNQQEFDVEQLEPMKKIQRLDQETESLAESERNIEINKATRTMSLNDGTADGYFFDDEQPTDSKTWLSKAPVAESRENMKITELQEEILFLRKALDKSNVVASDLEFEKITLEKVVLDLQKKIKLKIKVSENGCSFVDVSDQGSETDISSLEWDNLTEATEDCRLLTEELAHAKASIEQYENAANELTALLSSELEKNPVSVNAEGLPENTKSMNLLETAIHQYLKFSSQQMLRFEDEINNYREMLCKRDDEREQTASRESAMADENEKLNAALLRLKELAVTIWELFTEKRAKRTGTSPEHLTEGQSCESIILQVKGFAVDFINEFSNHTEADKWKENYDDLLRQKNLVAAELEGMRSELQIWKEKHRETVDENGSLLESIDMLRQDLELMSQGQSAISAEREQLQTELDKLQFQIDTNETDDSKEIGELKMQLDDLKLERDRIIRMVNDRDEFIVEQQEKHDSLVYQLMEEKDRDLQEIQSQLEETMTLFKEKQDECSKMTLHIASLEEDNKYIKERSDELESKSMLSSKKIEQLERELNDKMQKVVEKDVMLKSLEVEDEELREKEMIEEDMLREQEILIQDLRSENEYLRDELNCKELRLKKLENMNDSNKSLLEGDRGKHLELRKSEFGQYNEEDIENWRKKANEFSDLLKEYEKLSDEAVSYKKSAEFLETKLADCESCRKTRQSPTIEEANDLDDGVSGECSNNFEEERLISSVTNELNSESSNVTDIVRTEDSEGMVYPVNSEEKRLVEDVVKAQERIRELELEVETYKKFEMSSNHNKLEIERLKSEVSRMMQVLVSKDELLLNLQMMEDEGVSDSPFSSRARVIQHIRDKDAEIQNIRSKYNSLEELSKHHSSQLDLLKVERQNLLIFLKQKEAEIIDLNERLENMQARSAAKEHASTVLHAEHQKLVQLNKSQGSEIARLRERNQYLQNLLEERRNYSANDRLINERNQELEIQVAAFQQEQERLLTVIHEKENFSNDLKKELQRLRTVEKTTGSELKPKGADLVDKPNNEPLLTSEMEHGSKASSDALQKYVLEISDLKDQLHSLSEIHSKLTNDNNELKQKLDLNDTEKRKIRTLMENQNFEQSSKIADLESNLSDMEKRVIDMNRNFELERSRMLQNFEARNKLAAQEWEEKVRLKDQEIKSLVEQVDLLQSVGKINAENSSKGEESDQLHLENKKLRSLYEEKKNDIALLQNDIYKLKNITSAHEAALSKMQNDNKYLIEEGTKKDSTIEVIERKKILAEQKIQELETEVHRLRVSCKEIEAKSLRDMERLRNHLIEVEEGYTSEAVAAQEKENDLQKQLRELQDLYQARNAEFKETSNQSHFQIHNLQQQLFAIATQRDDVVVKLSQTQERLQQTETALNNLQLVLERLQREKDSQYEMLEEESRKKLIMATKEINDLKKREASFQARIQEATLAVQGVASLSHEVQSKEKIIGSLKKEVNALQEDLHSKSDMVRKLKDSTEGKVEKPLMKNLLLGYFHAPENKRPEVVRVLGNLVGFSQNEINEVGSGAPPAQRTWVSTFIPFGSAAPQNNPYSIKPRQATLSDSLSKSFTEMFVSFLEEESSGAAKNRPASNQLTALLMETSSSTSTPVVGAVSAKDSVSSSLVPSAASNPLLITPQDARAMHASTFKTSLSHQQIKQSPLATSLFPAPGQEIPRVHTSTANSALKSMLSKQT